MMKIKMRMRMKGSWNLTWAEYLFARCVMFLAKDARITMDYAKFTSTPFPLTSYTIYLSTFLTSLFWNNIECVHLDHTGHLFHSIPIQIMIRQIANHPSWLGWEDFHTHDASLRWRHLRISTAKHKTADYFLCNATQSFSTSNHLLSWWWTWAMLALLKHHSFRLLWHNDPTPLYYCFILDIALPNCAPVNLDYSEIKDIFHIKILHFMSSDNLIIFITSIAWFSEVSDSEWIHTSEDEHFVSSYLLLPTQKCRQVITLQLHRSTHFIRQYLFRTPFILALPSSHWPLNWIKVSRVRHLFDIFRVSYIIFIGIQRKSNQQLQHQNIAYSFSFLCTNSYRISP